MIEEESDEDDAQEGVGYGEPFDVSLVAKALILFGLVILVIYLILRFLAVTTYADDMWMDTTVLGPGVFEGVVSVVFIFMFFGLIAYLIHIQFLKLALIAEDVMGLDVTKDRQEDETADLNLEESA